jgi:hypothetical protein
MNDKELALRVMMLLSALESWGFAVDKTLPDYLLEELEYLQEALRKVVLG